MNRQRALLLSLLPALVLCHVPIGAARAEEPKQYEAKFVLYRVSGLPIHVLTEEQAQGLANPPVEDAWTSRKLGLNFDGMHLDNILSLLSQKFEVNFTIEEGLVAPRNRRESNSPSNDTPETSYTTDGIVDIHVQNITLRDFLTAILEPLGLDYFVFANSVWITTPERAASRAPIPTYTPSDELLVQDAGAVVVGDTVVPLGPEADDDKRNEFPESEHVRIISRPRILLMEGQEASIATTDISPIDYFVLRGGTASEPTFELKHDKKKRGMILTTSVRGRDEDAAEMDLKVWAGYVTGREPVEGTSLPVGRPIYRETEVEATTRVGLGQRAIALARIGKQDEDALLILFRVSPVSLDKAAKEEVSLPEYTVDMRFIQMDGRPDWGVLNEGRNAFDAAGVRVTEEPWFGPVDWAQVGEWNGRDDRPGELGFRAWESVRLVSAPRVTYIVDLKRHLDEGRARSLFKVLVAPDQVRTRYRTRSQPRTSAEMVDISKHYNRLAPESWHRTFRREDVEGKAIIVTKTSGVVPYREPGFWLFARKHELTVPEGIFAMLEATSADSPGRYRVNQLVQFRLPHLGIPDRIVGEEAARATRFSGGGHFSYEVEHGQTVGYLLPVQGDEYVLVLSTFKLVDKKSSKKSP